MTQQNPHFPLPDGNAGRRSSPSKPGRLPALLLCLALVVLLPFLAPPSSPAAESGAPPSSRQSIRVVLDDTYPPYIMRGEDGTLKGILVDQWRLWEEKTGIHAEVTAMDWAEAQRRMLAGEFDVIDTIFRTEQREKLYDFSKPYARLEVPLFFHSDISGIRDVEDARGFLVGVKEGDAVIEFLHGKGLRSLAEFRSYESLIAAAREGQVKVFSVDQPPAHYFLNKMGISERFRETDPLYSGEFHRAVRKGNTALLAQVEQGFDQISQEEYRDIDHQWLGSPISLPLAARNLWIMAAVILVALLILLLWVFTLRRSIAARTAELRQSGEKYRRLHESMIEAFVAVDMSGRIMESNRVYQEMLGYTAEELGRLTYVDLTPEKWHAFETGLVEAQVLPHGFSEVYEKEYRRKDGTIFPVELRTFLIRDAQGQPERMWAIVRDLTEKKKMEAERLEMERRLLHAQKLESLGVMAGGIAHDFNNLLMAILGNLDLALLDLPPGSPARENINQSMQAARRAAELTRQMLAYSGKGHFVVQPLDMNELVRENYHLFMASASKNVRFSFRPAERLPRIIGDPGQIQQVVMNLITNASEALEEKDGIVTIKTGEGIFDEKYLKAGRQQKTPPAGRFVWLEVADTGCGMDKETLQRLFDPFFTTKFTGRGLGMSAILGIIHGHEGAILVTSEKGRGTTIRALFPALAEATAQPEARRDATAGPAAPESRAPRGMVLLVDDEEVVRLVCSAMLRRLGWTVLEAEDGVQAVEVFRNQAAAIRLTIMDLSMPRMSGMEAFREIRRIDPQALVLLASGFSAGDNLEVYIDEGVAGFIGKPFELEKLREEIEGVTGKG